MRTWDCRHSGKLVKGQSRCLVPIGLLCLICVASAGMLSLEASHVSAQSDPGATIQRLIWSQPWDIVSVDISPDGQSVLIGVLQGDTPNTYLVDLNHPQPSLLVPGLTGGVWSPDGDRVALDGLWLSDSRGENVIQLDEGGFYPSWSPDGSQLAYLKSSDGGPESQLTVIDLGSGEARGVVTTPGPTARPLWSPDGERLLYGVGFIGKVWYLTDLNGAQQRKISGESPAYEAAWSPDGTHIAYATDDGIWVVDLVGDSHRQICAHGSDPLWSDDGRTICFYSRTTVPPAPYQIWETKADGERLKQIGPQAGILGNTLIWSPIANQILVSSKTGPDYTLSVVAW